MVDGSGDDGWMSIVTAIYESAAFGPFMGVFLGFAVNYVYQSYKCNQDKNNYKSMIRSELGICIRILEEDEIRLLPRDHWISALNSGALKLFEVETELEPLSKLYTQIKDHNHDTTVGMLWKDLEPKGYELTLLKRRELLLLELNVLKSEQWLESKSWLEFWK